MKPKRTINKDNPVRIKHDLVLGSSTSYKYQIPFSAIVPFLFITFCIAWTILGLFIFLPEKTTKIFGELTGQHPLFFLAVYAPAIAAFVIIIYKTGVQGLKGFLSRFLIWRSSLSWYVFLFLGIPLIFIAGSFIKGNLFTDPFPIWGVWHLPAFLLSGTQQSEWSFAPFFIGCVALSIIVTPLFNQSHGSILLTAFFHFMLMNPVFPDAQPYDTYIIIVIAFIIVWINRKTMFSKEGAITRVIPLTEKTNNVY